MLFFYVYRTPIVNDEKGEKESEQVKPHTSSATASFQFAQPMIKKYPAGFMDGIPSFNEFVDHIPSRSAQR